DELKERVTSLLARVEVMPEAPPDPMFQPHPQPMFEHHPDPAMAGAMAEAELEMAGAEPPMRVTALPVRNDDVDPRDPATWAATPRNAPCPCGSGKKYKHCHGRVA